MVSIDSGHTHQDFTFCGGSVGKDGVEKEQYKGQTEEEAQVDNVHVEHSKPCPAQSSAKNGQTNPHIGHCNNIIQMPA